MATVVKQQKRHVHLGKGEIWALISAFAYGADNVFASRGVTSDGQGLDPVIGVVLRATPIMLFTLIMSFFMYKRDPEAVSVFSSWKYFLFVVSHGLLTFVIGNTLLFNAFRTGGVMVTTPLLGTNVLWGALIAAFVFREVLNKRMLLGIFISIAGVFVLRLGQNTNITLPENWIFAVPLAIGAAFCWALGGVFITNATRNKVDRFQALAVSLIFSLIVLNTYLAITGKISQYWTAPFALIGNVLFAGVFNTVALVGVTTAMMYTTLASAGTLSSLQVAIAPLLAWLLFGEEVNFMYIVALMLILFGVIIVQRSKPMIPKPVNTDLEDEN